MKRLDRKTLNKRAGLFFSIIVALSFLLFISQPDVAINYMKRGLDLCARTVIPSLFPLMVVSELTAKGPLGRLVGRLLSRPAALLLGVGEDSACALIFGAICGFPIGARTLCHAYDRGQISSRELSRSLSFCNNPGAAFVISAVGVSVFGSLNIGILLFIAVMVSAILVGIIARLVFGRVKNRSLQKEKIAIIESKPARSVIHELTGAVQSSAISMLTVCAFVTFFSALVGCIGAILSQLGVSNDLSAVVICIFELSGGVRAASELPYPLSLLLAAATLGWSGISVHFQIMTVVGDRKARFLPYFLSKLAQGILSAALVAIFLQIFNMFDIPIGEIAVFNEQADSKSGFLLCAFIVFVSILTIFIDKIRIKQCKKSNRKFF